MTVNKATKITQKTTPISISAQAAEQAVGGVSPDIMRDMLKDTIQKFIQDEFNQFIGALPYKRSEGRQGYRNGSYQRKLKTRVGSIELEIPRDREGIFRPSLFARYERSEQALVLAMVEMYLQGVSTRKVSAVVEQLCGTSISASEVSTLTRKLDAHLSAWRERRLDDTDYAAIVIDAHVESVRREGHVRSTAALWVIGLTENGYREHLGVWMGPSESEASWANVFRDLVERGLKGVRYVVSDEHTGLVQSARRYFPEAMHQRCQVHYLRNALDKISSERTEQIVTEGLRDAWNATTEEESRIRMKRLIDTLRPIAPDLADWMEDTHHATLACYIFDKDSVRKKLRSTNSVERHHREVRRRTRVINIFPHQASLQRLLTALAIEQNEQWRTQRWIIHTVTFKQDKQERHMPHSPKAA